MHNQNFSQQITATAFLALGCNEKRILFWRLVSCSRKNFWTSCDKAEDLSEFNNSLVSSVLHFIFFITATISSSFYSVTFVNCHYNLRHEWKWDTERVTLSMLNAAEINAFIGVVWYNAPNSNNRNIWNGPHYLCAPTVWQNSNSSYKCLYLKSRKPRYMETRFQWNRGNSLPDYMSPYPSWQQHSYSMPWKPQTSLNKSRILRST